VAVLIDTDLPIALARGDDSPERALGAPSGRGGGV